MRTDPAPAARLTTCCLLLLTSAAAAGPAAEHRHPRLPPHLPIPPAARADGGGRRAPSRRPARVCRRDSRRARGGLHVGRGVFHPPVQPRGRRRRARLRVPARGGAAQLRAGGDRRHAPHRARRALRERHRADRAGGGVPRTRAARPGVDVTQLPRPVRLLHGAGGRATRAARAVRCAAARRACW